MLVRRAGLALAAVVVAVGSAGCSADAGEGPVEAAQLAVTVDATGDEQQSRAMEIAGRYAPGGNFTLEQETSSQVSSSGASGSRVSAVVVFTVTGDVAEVVDRLRDEAHVLAVTRR